MLTKQQRLTRREFETYFKSGRRFHTKNLQLIYSPRETFHGAIVVGKKVFKQAVKRNEMRRRLYGVLYRESSTRGLVGVYIIMAKPGAQAMSHSDLLTEAKNLLGQIK